MRFPPAQEEFRPDRMDRFPGMTWRDIYGLMTRPELEWLQALAQELSAEVEGGYLELGGFLGKSTIALAEVARGQGRPMMTVDLGLAWDAIPLLYLRSLAHRSPEASLQLLRENIALAGYAESVTVVEHSTHRLDWQADLALLYHDADHEAFPVAEDLRRFTPWIVPGGLLLLHDFGRPHHPGVEIAAQAVLQPEVWEDLGQTGWLKAYRRNP